MNKRTTIYLPPDLKAVVEQEARRSGTSEAEVIRRAIAAAVVRPAPRADELLAGSGER